MGTLPFCPDIAPRSPVPALELLPERAAYLPDWKALLVSDVHLGKSETFQHYGIPIPGQVNEGTLARLRQARDRTGATQLFVLGDLFHSRWSLVDAVIETWLRFLETTQLSVTLVLGNHDQGLAAALEPLSIRCCPAALPLASLLLSHGPQSSPDRLNICGHVHPCVRLGGPQDRLRLPCFYWEAAPARLTLPAFGDFTGGCEVALGPGAIAYVIADDQVIPFTAETA